MKLFCGLLVFWLVSAAVGFKHKAERHEVVSRSHPLVFSRRSASNSSGILHCDCVCTGTNSTGDNGWEIDISGIISLAYQKTQNVIAIYSRDNQLGIALDGNSGILLLFNVSAGGALVVNVTQGYAKLLTGSIQISHLFNQSAHLSDVIAVLAQVIFENSANLTVATGNVFDLSAALKLLRNGNSDLSSVFAGRLQLYQQFVANFGATLNYLLIYYRTVKIFAVKYNAVELIAAVAHHFPSLQIALIRLVNSLYVSLGGKFNLVFALEIYKELSSASAILSGDLFIALSNALQGIGSLFADLAAAIKAVAAGIRFDNITSVVTRIGGTTGVIVSASYNNSWLLDIRGNLNNSFNFILGYNESLKVLGFYNRKVNLTAVFVGSTNLIGIFNVTSGGGLLINATNGIAKVITSTSINFRAIITNAASFIEGLGVTLQYADQINGSINTLLNSEDVFDLNGVITAAKLPAFNLRLLFLLRSSLYDKLQANFGALFVNLNQGFLNGSISSSLSILGLFAYIAGDLAGFSNSLVELIVVLSSKAISFESSVFLIIYQSITLRIEEFISGRLLLAISASINKLGSVYVDIVAAIKGGIAAASSLFGNLTVGVLTIGGRIINLEYGSLADGSWIITLVASNKSLLNIGVVYDKTLNVLGVINRNLNIGVIFNGNLGIYAIFNATAGSGLVVNSTSGVALLLTSLGNYSYLFAESINIYEGIVIYSKLLFEQVDVVLSQANAFDLQAVLALIRDGKDWSVLFNGRWDLYVRLQASFGALFVLISSNIQSGVVDLSQGAISITVLIFGNLQSVSQGFLQLFISLYVRVGGVFDVRLALVIFQELLLNINAAVQGSILSRLTLLINEIGVIYENIDQALSSIIDNQIFANVSTGFIKFGDINVTASLGLALDGTWLVNLIGQVNSSLNIVLGYNRSINVVGILNRRDNLAAIINGDFGLLAIFNLSSSAGLVVNASSGIALLVNASVELSGLVYQSIEVFSVLNEILIEYSSEIILSGNNAFNLTAVVVAIESKVDLSTVFAGKLELYREVLLQFGGSLTIIGKLLVGGVVSVKQGAVVVVAVVFGELTVISKSVVTLLVNLYQNVRIKGKFAVEFAFQVFVSFREQLGRSVTVFLKSLIGIVKSVGILVDNLAEAIAGYISAPVIPTTPGITVFDNTTVNISQGILIDGSWIISLRSRIDSSINLDLVYNKTLNLFGVYNRQFNYSVVFNGNNGIFGLFNVTAGSVILANVTSGLGKFLTIEADLSYLFETSAVFGVSVLGRLLVNEIAGLDGVVNLDAAIFDLKALVTALDENTDWSVIFQGHAELYAEVVYSFRVYFSIVADRLQSGVISIKLGILALVQASLSLNAKLAVTVVDLLNALYLRVRGLFDAEVFFQVFLRFVKSVGGSFQTKALEALINAILAIGSLYGNLIAALNSLANVTIDVKAGIFSIGGISLNLTYGSSDFGSWLVELGGKFDVIDFGIAYNKSLNVIGFYNYKLDLTVIISGSTGIVGVFNASSGAGLLINGTNNVGKYIAGAADVTYLFRLSVLRGVSVLGSLVANASLDVNITQNLQTYFDVSLLLNALENQVVNLTAVFKEQVELITKLEIQFYGLLSIIRQRFLQGIVSIQIGVVVFLSGVLDFAVESIARGLLNLFTALFVRVRLLFDAAFALQIWLEFTVNTIKAVLFETLIAVVQGIGTAYGNLLDAINAITSLSWLRTLVTDVLRVGNFSGNLSKAISADSAWLVEIVGAIEVDVNVKIDVVYDNNLNILGVYNAALGLVVVFDGTLQRFGFFNVTTGNGLLVDYFKGEAGFVASSSLSYLFASKTEVVLAISQVGKVLQQSVNNITAQNKVNFTQIITLLSQRQDWRVAVQGSVDIREKLEVNFGGLFVHLSVKLQTYFKASFGVINALWVFFEIDALAQGFVQLIAAIYSNLRGLFTVALLAVVFAQFVVTVAGIFFGTLINAILSIVFPVIGGIQLAVSLILQILGVVVGVNGGVSGNANVSISERHAIHTRHQLPHVKNAHQHLKLGDEKNVASNLAYKAHKPLHSGNNNRKHPNSHGQHKSRNA